MKEFNDYLENISDPIHKSITKDVLSWVAEKFPNLVPRIAWNQPMFTDHGTFIIGFNVAKNHLSIAPEKAALDFFSDEIKQSGYKYSAQLFYLPWDTFIDYSLLERIIKYNISDKANCSTFWRK